MGRPKSYERDEVLDKAMKLFWKKGFEGTHLQELVETTGLNRFSLYKEFGGKEGLFEEAVGKYLVGIQQLGRTLKREPLGLDNIVEYIWQLIHSDFTYGCFMVNTLTQRFVVEKKITGRIQGFIEAAEHATLENLQAAQQKGEIAKDVDLEGLAKFIGVLDIGLVTYQLLDPKIEDKERIWKVLKGLLMPGKRWEEPGEVEDPERTAAQAP